MAIRSTLSFGSQLFGSGAHPAPNAPRPGLWVMLRAIWTRRQLAEMDDRMLRDIGIERGQIWHATRHGREALLRSSELQADFTRWS